MLKERKTEYEALRDARLANVGGKEKNKSEAKKQNKDDFSKRQAQRLAAEDEEKRRLANWRKEQLAKNRKEFALEGEPGYGPTRWCWPTAHYHPRHCNGTGGAGVGENDVLLTSPLLGPGAMVSSPAKDIKNDALLILSKREFTPQQGEGELLKLAETLPDQLESMKERDFKVRLMRAEAERQAEEERKLEREAESKARQEAILAREAAAKKAEIMRSRQIKKEMAEETKKAAKDAAAKEKVRFDKAQAERVEMVRHLKMDMKLRDEDEIANERREGSSMSKGGKADFVSAAKTAGNDDMVGF